MAKLWMKLPRYVAGGVRPSSAFCTTIWSVDCWNFRKAGSGQIDRERSKPQPPKLVRTHLRRSRTSCRRILRTMKFDWWSPICGGAATAANPWQRRRDAPPRAAPSGPRGCERSRVRCVNFQRDHFEIAHHPINDEPRDDVKAAHAHQHRNVADMRNHSSGYDPRK